MDLGLDLEGTIVVVTGAGGQIGQVIVEAFLKAGCFVAAIDIDDSRLKRQHDNLLPMECDTTDERSVFSAWSAVAMRFGSWPTVCVCAAALDLSFVKHHASITEMSAEQFRKTLDVNVTGTFITAKAWLSHIPRADGSSLVHLNSDQNFSLIIIGSEAGIMVVPGNPDYASSKSAVQYGLMLSLAPDAVRINPGQVAKREATSVTMGFGCGFDIYPRLEATDSNIEKYGFLIRSTILKYEDVYDDDSRHPEGRVLDIATESGSHFGTNYNLSFLVGEIPRMPVDADRCNNYFLRFSSKVQRVAHSSS
ncbi:2,5-dichloro-2,5-cyclohexadiene-1,4-diol dehydrogenase [Colletotrichum fructicola]|nr:2,5-dichloro-2,5-cyclohexadiene-1,4-diol dehydrogenase [Colletotrichum fructicola]KAF4884676.1 2,5-dichloro-2,5-cyclohexadiene-1,4-diol dehydrogenase [Colletotrichum fructicola]KAF4888269.1 2,5-dichloro-2,5-cyclohexadiene-1,4-diol dehydrogenase [Colletotrichum fructicola]KAF4924468.1 2,5-dichloro-2,5-cyclohexadiene-1,4-diol dehydrogenase [Colletotrichum fructicola]